jgi:ribonucleoside-diphosphate reductase beta chain
VISTLKLFSLYEDQAGNDWWSGRFKQMFIDDNAAVRMASTFSFFECSVHQPFYNKINELLHINTPEFYLSYLDNPTLKSRIEHIDSIVNDPSDLVSLGMFSLVEGVILYSSFAFLKHFQSQGKNKLLNIVRGVNFSLRDENIHSLASARAFKHMLEKKNVSKEELEILERDIRLGATLLLEHETEIIRMIFEKGTIDGITETQLTHFVQSRINNCLKELGFSKQHTVKYDPISDWFYKAINDYTFNDFFSGLGSQYHRNWDETSFIWKQA